MYIVKSTMAEGVSDKYVERALFFVEEDAVEYSEFLTSRGLLVQIEKVERFYFEL